MRTNRDCDSLAHDIWPTTRGFRYIGVACSKRYRSRVRVVQMLLTPVGHSIDGASPAEQERLGLSAGDEVLRLERLQYAGGKVRTFERSVLPLHRIPGIHVNRVQYLTLAEIADQFGVRLGRATERLSIVSAPPSVARALAVNPTDKLLQIDRVTTTVDGTAIEWRLAHVMEMSS